MSLKDKDHIEEEIDVAHWMEKHDTSEIAMNHQEKADEPRLILVVDVILWSTD